MKRIHGERPKTESKSCLNCGRRLRAMFETEWKRFDEPGHIWTECWYTGKILGYGIGDGLFCTTICAQRYGLRAAWAGVRFDALDPKRVKVGKKEKADAAA